MRKTQLTEKRLGASWQCLSIYRSELSVFPIKSKLQAIGIKFLRCKLKTQIRNNVISTYLAEGVGFITWNIERQWLQWFGHSVSIYDTRHMKYTLLTKGTMRQILGNADKNLVPILVPTKILYDHKNNRLIPKQIKINNEQQYYILLMNRLGISTNRDAL